MALPLFLQFKIPSLLLPFLFNNPIHDGLFSEADCPGDLDMGDVNTPGEPGVDGSGSDF